MNIFLAPRANETSYKNFLSTIEHGVDYNIIEPHLSDEGREILGNRDKIFAWGNKETKRSSWEKMAIGDWVLFYKGSEGSETEGKFVYAGKHIFSQFSRELGLALWPPKPGEEPWSCVFFLDELKPVYIPVSVINEAAGYKPNHVVQGFMPLNEQGVNGIVSKYGTVDNFLSKHLEVDTQDRDIVDLEDANEVTAHAEAQMLLLKIGQMLGYDTYSPDKSAEAYGEQLKDYISVDKVPTRFIGELENIISQIDVIWFKEDFPKYAFEVEHTTKFNNGFSRLFQLSPLETKLIIVSSEKNRRLYDKFIDSAPYYTKKDKYSFRTYKQLEKYFKSVSEFSTISTTFLS